MTLQSTATTAWTGTLAAGSGTTSLASGAAPPLRVTWQARTEEHGGLTSPEELIAAAHASCYSMALAAGLGRAGATPVGIDTTATADFGQVDGGWAMTRIHLEVRATVEGIDADGFAAVAAATKDGCPVSKALAGNVDITLDAALA